ncbi:hypothetical protein GBAR_LOCUS29564 [Geodia barretti]|uniref:Uncharacterized protein n=1 Tax=Geodia barretti TaxID=519541 RepID=A0AA35XIW8_GEOBA|nr:hypothetical protein GBAR_LOCUS29564 [Geodia barretti]
MNVSERGTAQDQQFSKEKDVPAVSLGHPQGALVHQNRDVKHQASSHGEMVGGEMVSRPEQLEVNETVTPMDTASPPRAERGMKRRREAEPSNPRIDRRMSDQ